jgi:hypothetical protein
VSRVRDLWWTTGARGEKKKTSRHPDKGGDRNAKRWLAVWQLGDGAEASRAFSTRIAAEKHAAAQETDIDRGHYTSPKDARITVSAWCDIWLAGYAGKRPSTVRQARTHIAQIRKEFGRHRLAAVRPSAVKAWTARLKVEGHEASYIYALHARLAQIMKDAVHDGKLMQSPCSRRTAPPMGQQRPYLATTEQVWGAPCGDAAVPSDRGAPWRPGRPQGRRGVRPAAR